MRRFPGATQEEIEQRIATNFKNVARMNHTRALELKHPGHANHYFQHCPGGSCRQAFEALYLLGAYGPVQKATRQKKIEELYEKLRRKSLT